MSEDILLRHRLANTLQSILLLGGMGGLLALVGYTLAGGTGLVWIAILGLISMALSPRFSPRWLMRLYGARHLPHDAFPQLHELLHTLVRRAGLSHAPDLYYVPSRILNAFAVGHRHNAAIAVTDGLLQALNLRELAGVLAHEVSHIRHNDLSVMAISDWVSRATSILSNIGQFALLITFPMWLFGGNVPVVPWLILIAAPWISTLLQLGLSRTREFDADRGAVELTGDPEGLASALLKLEQAKISLLRRILLPGWGNPEPSWLRTHPATSERIERLMEIKPSRPAIPWGDASFHPMNVQLIRSPRWRWPGLWY